MVNAVVGLLTSKPLQPPPQCRCAAAVDVACNATIVVSSCYSLSRRPALAAAAAVASSNLAKCFASMAVSWCRCAAAAVAVVVVA